MATVSFQLQRTTYQHLKSAGLLDVLERELQEIYELPHDHILFPCLSKTEEAAYQAIIILVNKLPVACGTFRQIDCPQSVDMDKLFSSSEKRSLSRKCAEVNRVFVADTHRGRSNGDIAFKLMAALEQWGIEQGYDCFVLKTANRQLGAIRLYERAGWQHIALYGEAYPKGITFPMAKRLT